MLSQVTAHTESQVLYQREGRENNTTFRVTIVTGEYSCVYLLLVYLSQQFSPAGNISVFITFVNVFLIHLNI